MSKRLLVIVLFAAALWIPGYLCRDLWEPDEARYAYVAQEMRAGNHWFVPHRHGDFYAHKPPLMFWLINAGACLTGGEIGRLATRLPSLLGVILALWSVSIIAELWGDRRAAWRAIFITATTLAIWWRAGWGQIDMLLCGLQMAGLCLLFVDDKRHTVWRPLLAYCCFGLGILAKGPVGFIVPVGAYVTSNLVAGSVRNLRRWHWLWGFPVVLLWPAVWLLLAKLTGGSDAYFNELLLKQNADRAVGGFGHIRPFYYYFEYLLVDGLPWILVLPFSVWALRKQTGKPPITLRRALGWFGFVVLFFSVLPTKRSLYILLAYPALAVAVSAGLPYQKWGRQIQTYVIMFFVVLYVIAANVGLPHFNAMKTPHALVPEVQSRVREGEALLLYKINAEILPYYCERRGEVYWVESELRQAMLRQEKGVVVFLDSVWEEMKTDYGQLGETGTFEMGHKRFVWLAFSI
jgi:4-amino-4-deoxy-L-arabinose transferase-like glycosyltransferase